MEWKTTKASERAESTAIALAISDRVIVVFIGVAGLIEVVGFILFIVMSVGTLLLVEVVDIEVDEEVE